MLKPLEVSETHQWWSQINISVYTHNKTSDFATTSEWFYHRFHDSLFFQDYMITLNPLYLLELDGNNTPEKLHSVILQKNRINNIFLNFMP